MTLTFAHHKGGTGKTTSCTSVAGFAQKAGKRVLVVDVDPQANATAALGVDGKTLKVSLLDVLAGAIEAPEAVLETASGVHLLPASLDLVAAEPVLYARSHDRMGVLRQALKPLAAHYDLILLDTPPGVGVLMLNVLAAVDEVVAALDPGVFAYEDLRTLDTILADLRAHDGASPALRAAVVSRAMRPSLRNRLSGHVDPLGAVIDDLRRRFDPVVIVPYDRAIFEAQRQGLPVSHTAPNSPSGRAYHEITQWVLQHD